ncbi:10807_t:CDS:2, partial [Funneliformis geosporum]
NNRRFEKKLYIVDDWEDENDSGWDDEVDLLKFEQKKRRPYLARKTKKSIYFDKYGLSGSFTKAAKGTSKISTFFKKNQSTPEDFEEVLNDMEDEGQNQLDLKKRIENLKIKLKEQQKSLIIAEYNKKRAIFEYLRQLDNNGNGKIKASVEAYNCVLLSIHYIDVVTVTRWLNVLGYYFQSQKQGTYYDDHERPDIIKYRKLFLDEIYNYEKFMAKYE